MYRYIMNDPLFCICVVQFEEVAQLWHRRLGHINQHSLCSLATKETVVSVLLISGIPSLCNNCLEGKQARHRKTKTATRRSEHPLQLIHSDLCGSPFPPSLGGAQYFVAFIDDFSRHTWVFFLAMQIEHPCKLLNFQITSRADAASIHWQLLQRLG